MGYRFLDLVLELGHLGTGCFNKLHRFILVHNGVLFRGRRFLLAYCKGSLKGGA